MEDLIWPLKLLIILVVILLVPVTIGVLVVVIKKIPVITELISGIGKLIWGIAGIGFLIFIFVLIPIVSAFIAGGGGGGYENEEQEYYEEEPGVHWVDDYERSDGTEVEGHWRSNPDGNPNNNLNP